MVIVVDGDVLAQRSVSFSALVVFFLSEQEGQKSPY
jgi:hypothetical protein